MNKVILVGRLTKDPSELRGNENKVGHFTIAVNRNFTNQQGEREADFIQIKTFKKLAENCSKFLRKGSLVSIEASIRTGSFDKDGKKIFTMEVIADNVRFLDGKRDSSDQNNNLGHTNSSYIPEDGPFANSSDFEPESDWPFS